MKFDWWFDSLLLLILILLLITIYYLSKRFIAAEKADGITDDDWLKPGSENQRAFPAKMIRYAGINPKRIKIAYWLAKIVLAVLCPLVVVEFMRVETHAWYFILAATAGFFSIDAWIWNRARQRKARIQSSVSFFSDLLVAFLKSGMSLPQAFKRAASHGLPKALPLTAEVQIVAMELEMGLNWQAAFDKLAQRTGVKDLQRIALIMQIGYKTGIPVVTSLAKHADLLREKQRERVNELLNRKTLEALIPTLLLSMPMFLVLVFFPTGVQIYEAFQLFTSSW